MTNSKHKIKRTVPTVEEADKVMKEEESPTVEPTELSHSDTDNNSGDTVSERTDGEDQHLIDEDRFASDHGGERARLGWIASGSRGYHERLGTTKELVIALENGRGL